VPRHAEYVNPADADIQVVGFNLVLIQTLATLASDPATAALASVDKLEQFLSYFTADLATIGPNGVGASNNGMFVSHTVDEWFQGYLNTAEANLAVMSGMDAQDIAYTGFNPKNEYRTVEALRAALESDPPTDVAPLRWVTTLKTGRDDINTIGNHVSHAGWSEWAPDDPGSPLPIAAASGAGNHGYDNEGNTGADRGTYRLAGLKSMMQNMPLQRWPTVWENGPYVYHVRPEFGEQIEVWNPLLGRELLYERVSSERVHDKVHTNKFILADINGKLTKNGQPSDTCGSNAPTTPACFAWGLSITYDVSVDDQVLLTTPVPACIDVGAELTLNQGGANGESIVVASFDPLVLAAPLQFNHTAGEPLELAGAGRRLSGDDECDWGMLYENVIDVRYVNQEVPSPNAAVLSTPNYAAAPAALRNSVQFVDANGNSLDGVAPAEPGNALYIEAFTGTTMRMTDDATLAMKITPASHFPASGGPTPTSIPEYANLFTGDTDNNDELWIPIQRAQVDMGISNEQASEFAKAGPQLWYTIMTAGLAFGIISTTVTIVYSAIYLGLIDQFGKVVRRASSESRSAAKGRPPPASGRHRTKTWSAPTKKAGGAPRSTKHAPTNVALAHTPLLGLAPPLLSCEHVQHLRVFLRVNADDHLPRSQVRPPAPPGRSRRTPRRPSAPTASPRLSQQARAAMGSRARRARHEWGVETREHLCM
jgi:hypothetical protein